MKRSGTFVIDGWEDDLRRSLYGSAVARVGEPTLVLGLEDLTGHRGSALRILDAADTAMAEMGIEKASCILGLVTDNPAVMQAFRKSFVKKYPWVIAVACWAHQTNTLAGEMCRFPAIKSAIQRGNHIVTFFNGLHYWGGQLKAVALAEKITRGLKKNCESRWYAIILLAMSVEAHQTPLSLLVARPDARKVTGGFSAVNGDVIRTIQDYADDFWPWISRLIRVARPFVDSIAACEGRDVTLADCMLSLLGAARQLNFLDPGGDDTADFLEFCEHACAVVDKRFRKMATPIHRLALFLHPICRKLAVVEDAPGYTLRDIKRTVLQVADQWSWEESEARALILDIDEYYGCTGPFTGGQSDGRGWWQRNTAAAKRPLKPFAEALLSITPHSAEIERLFSACNGIQSAKRNSLAVDTFSKLAKVRSSLIEEAKRRLPAKLPKITTELHTSSSERAEFVTSTRITGEGAPLERNESLEKWEAPLDDTEDSDGVSGVDSVFAELDKMLEEEEDAQEAESDAEESEEEDLPARLTAAVKPRKAAKDLSLMGGDIYDFELVKKALDNIVPRAEVKKVDVVRDNGRGRWKIDDLL
ncbi:ribonuclease H-like domain-containing protein [Mycena pura]|uniref:Ribonuclease H-like domain-containing protein n=1 Tax=Mycena pura TaxID=153505 RepID=A0AAD6Y532_9AGAR|nr:ribonuclease H-like domain-containing protein [Mycena pura]